MATLICKQCGHENEAERVYCHNCGTKLDRSLLPDDGKKQDSKKEQHKRVKKLTSPARGLFVGWVSSLISSIVWALLLACCIQMLRPPDGIAPVAKKEDAVEAPQILMAIEDAKAMRTPQRLALEASAVNGYLRAAIKPNQTGALADYVKFDRAFVNLDEGDFRMTTQQSLSAFSHSYAVYASVDYKLAIAGDKVTTTTLAGHIGRLPIHPMLMDYADMIFQNLWTALQREHKLADGMQSIEVHKNQIVMTTKPPAPTNVRR